MADLDELKEKSLHIFDETDEDKREENKEDYNTENSYYQDYTKDYKFENDYQDIYINKRANSYQIASLVLGIIGIPACCCAGLPGLILGLLGIILAVIGNSKGTKGIGVAGLVVSIIAFVFGIIATAYYGCIIAAIYYDAGPFFNTVENYTIP